MRRWVMAVCVCAGVVALDCDKLPAPAPELGQLVFQKDSTCADTTNTELYIDNTSQGQYNMRPGSEIGFNVTASTHIAYAAEREKLLRTFSSQAVVVPPLGQGFYTYKCASRPPPESASVARPGPHS